MQNFTFAIKAILPKNLATKVQILAKQICYISKIHHTIMFHLTQFHVQQICMKGIITKNVNELDYINT